jgi:hypothetical protein
MIALSLSLVLSSTDDKPLGSVNPPLAISRLGSSRHKPLTHLSQDQQSLWNSLDGKPKSHHLLQELNPWS